MKRAVGILTILALCLSVPTGAQTTKTTTTTTTTQKSIGAALNVYVFPSSGQSSSQQSKDESACYQWAVKETGSDPFRLQEKAEAQARAQQYNQSTAEGSAVRGAAGGAAAGALIGAIAGNAGTGAAIGAASGAIINRRRAKKQQEANEANISSAQQATAEQIDNFKKAFSACLEAKKYQVKY